MTVPNWESVLKVTGFCFVFFKPPVKTVIKDSSSIQMLGKIKDEI
jgi:hypothetical protein